jgi:tetratricopeptide (TPR) repeat protein
VNQIVEVEAKISQGQYLAAVDLIESIFELEKDIPSHHKSNLYRLIGDCFTKLGDTEGGKNAYVQAVELDPYSAKAHIGLGTVSLTKANYDIGVIHFQKAVGLSPNDEMASLGLGLSFHGLDELTEASKWVLKSLEINPENTAAIYTLVRIAQEREQYDDTEYVLRKYLKLHPHDHNMLYTLGGLLYKMQKYADVVDSLREIIAINPMDARAQSLIKQAKRAMEKQAQSSAG